MKTLLLLWIFGVAAFGQADKLSSDRSHAATGSGRVDPVSAIRPKTEPKQEPVLADKDRIVLLELKSQLADAVMQRNALEKQVSSLGRQLVQWEFDLTPENFCMDERRMVLVARKREKKDYPGCATGFR